MAIPPQLLAMGAGWLKKQAPNIAGMVASGIGNYVGAGGLNPGTATDAEKQYMAMLNRRKKEGMFNRGDRADMLQDIAMRSGGIASQAKQGIQNQIIGQGLEGSIIGSQAGLKADASRMQTLANANIGLKQVQDSLVVFMESGIYRLRVPSTDPRSFSLKEAEENIGCVSSRSIIQVGSYVFFASKDDLYVLTPSYEIQSCGSSIRDIWQSKSNKSKTFGIYDPLKHRILYVFGNDTSDVYAIDTEKFMYGNKEVWNHLY